jgi:hypothetical protein
MLMTRRQFQGSAAAVGDGVHARVQGEDYAVQGIDAAEWQGSVNWGGYKYGDFTRQP